MTAAQRKRNIGGRPKVRTDEETRAVIARAARDVFAVHGYAAASTDEIARRAAVSKKTLYRLIRTKEALFEAAVTVQVDHFLLSLDESTLAALSPEEALTRVLWEFGKLTLAAENAAFVKLVYAESDRFPELATDYYQSGMIATERVFIRCLERLRASGTIELENLEDATGMLKGMMIFEPARRAALARAPLPSPQQIKVRAIRCARLFLDGCRVSKQRS
jgi:AcrR family transcriptional regulator